MNKKLLSLVFGIFTGLYIGSVIKREQERKAYIDGINQFWTDKYEELADEYKKLLGEHNDVLRERNDLLFEKAIIGIGID